MPILTDYETGDPVFIRKDEIKSARPMPAITLKTGEKFGKRTRIHDGIEIFIVKETVLEVMADD